MQVPIHPSNTDVFQRDDLPFPHSLPEFQRLFPDDRACAAYLERSRWRNGFVCRYCQVKDEPYRFANRPSVLRCRKCQKDVGLTVGTAMENSHMPLSVWFWAAYLIASQTPGISAVQFQRQLGLSRYETAFAILHKLRAGMVRPDQDRIGGSAVEHVEVDESMVGGGHVAKAVESIIWPWSWQPLIFASANQARSSINEKADAMRGASRLAVVPNRSAKSLCGFVKNTVEPGTLVVTDDWKGYAGWKSAATNISLPHNLAMPA